MSEFEDRIFDHMELQKRLMTACGVFELSKDEQLEVSFLNIAGESIEAMGFVLDKTKPWKPSEFNLDEVREEVIDVYHFYLQFLVVADLYGHVSEVDGWPVITYATDKIVSLKRALKEAASEAADLSNWHTKSELEFFSTEQWLRFLTIFFCLDMTPEDVDRIYRAKNEKNFQRIKEKLGGTN